MKLSDYFGQFSRNLIILLGFTVANNFAKVSNVYIDPPVPAIIVYQGGNLSVSCVTFESYGLVIWRQNESNLAACIRELHLCNNLQSIKDINVEMVGDKSVMTISNLSIDHVNSYICTGGGVEDPVIFNLALLVDRPICKANDQENNFVIVERESIMYSCAVNISFQTDLEFKPILTWKPKAPTAPTLQVIPLSNYYTITSTFKVDAASEDANQMYDCSVIHEYAFIYNGELSYYCKMPKIDVYFCPKRVNITGSVEKEVSQNTRLYCATNSQPPAVYTWFRNNVTYSEGPVLLLQESGKYSCRVVIDANPVIKCSEVYSQILVINVIGESKEAILDLSRVKLKKPVKPAKSTPVIFTVVGLCIGIIVLSSIVSIYNCMSGKSSQKGEYPIDNTAHVGHTSTEVDQEFFFHETNLESHGVIQNHSVHTGSDLKNIDGFATPIERQVQNIPEHSRINKISDLYSKVDKLQ